MCNDVRIEPDLQPVSADQLNGASANSQDGARLDIFANGVWGRRFENSFFDVGVFNPFAPSNRNQDSAAIHKKHEREKKRAYEQRIREVEHSSFTPLVLSTTGSTGKEATNFLKMGYLTGSQMGFQLQQNLMLAQMSLGILTSSILHSGAIRGARSSKDHAIRTPVVVDLVSTESVLI